MGEKDFIEKYPFYTLNSPLGSNLISFLDNSLFKFQHLSNPTIS